MTTSGRKSNRRSPVSAPDFSVNPNSRNLSKPTGDIRLLALTGFMGAGKTTVGKLVASRQGWRFLDVDAVIETENGHSIAELFQKHGEAWFREREHRTIAELVQADSVVNLTETQAESTVLQPCVLALGGGAIEDARTRRLLLQSPAVRLIYLDVSLDEAIRRCSVEAQILRPVLADRERLAARYRQRLPLYRQAHLTVPVDGLLPEEIAQRIADHLSQIRIY